MPVVAFMNPATRSPSPPDASQLRLVACLLIFSQLTQRTPSSYGLKLHCIFIPPIPTRQSSTARNGILDPTKSIQ